MLTLRGIPVSPGVAIGQALVLGSDSFRIPQRFVAKSGPRNRIGRVFIDYLRNGWGATTVCAWAARDLSISFASSAVSASTMNS